MNQSEWQKVRVIHMISGFRRRDRTPDFVRKRERYFDKESSSWTRIGDLTHYTQFESE